MFGIFKPNVDKYLIKKDVIGLIKSLRYKKDNTIQQKAQKCLVDIGDVAGERLLNAINEEEYSDLHPILEQCLVKLLKQNPKILEIVTDVALNHSGTWKTKCERILTEVDPNHLSKEKVRRKERELYSCISKLTAWQRTFKNDDWIAGKKAVSSLGDIGDPRAIPHLIKLFREGNSEDSRNAVESLVKIGKQHQKEVVTPLIKMITAYVDRDWLEYDSYLSLSEIVENMWDIKRVWGAIWAIEVLGNLKEKSAIEFLTNLTKHTTLDKHVAQQAQNALNKIVELPCTTTSQSKTYTQAPAKAPVPDWFKKGI